MKGWHRSAKLQRDHRSCLVVQTCGASQVRENRARLEEIYHKESARYSSKTTFTAPCHKIFGYFATLTDIKQLNVPSKIFCINLLCFRKRGKF